MLHMLATTFCIYLIKRRLGEILLGTIVPSGKGDYGEKENDDAGGNFMGDVFFTVCDVLRLGCNSEPAAEINSRIVSRHHCFPAYASNR